MKNRENKELIIYKSKIYKYIYSQNGFMVESKL